MENTLSENNRLEAVFEGIRDIPYRIPTTIGGDGFSCAKKHILLKKSLEDMGYECRYRVCAFRWSDIELPKQVRSAPHQDNATHVYLEVNVNGKWIDIDATWDKNIRSVLPIGEWNAVRGTTIAVPLIRKFSLAKSREIMETESSEDERKDLEENGNFYAAFNQWLDDVRKTDLNLGDRFGFSMPEVSLRKTRKGLDRSIVEEISRAKGEPEWMRDFRLKSFGIFQKKKLPEWGPDLSAIDFDAITYYLRATDRPATSWDELPSEIRETYDRIGIPEAEKKLLSGVSAQYESEVVYESVNRELGKQGVIFCDMDTAVRKHADIVRKYFGTLVPPGDNAFAALNSAVWSGGSFVYVPKGVRVALPLQAYFRINAERFGQFERTLIIAEEGSAVHYTEGCTAPRYSTDSLHAAVVEVFVGKGARVRYTTVQNWSDNIYNLVTKRARAEEDAAMEWVDCNIGSKVTMKYPSVYLVGKGAHGDMLSIALAGEGQIQDAGAKMYHLAPRTTSRILSKSISKSGGQTSYRGLVHIAKNAVGARTKVSCDAMMIGDRARSDTFPQMTVERNDALVEHEATVEKIGEEKLFALTARGISREDAEGLLANGFIEPVSKEIPFEYSIELNRLIRYEMTKKIG